MELIIFAIQQYKIIENNGHSKRFNLWCKNAKQDLFEQYRNLQIEYDKARD
jgi:hypothetical protein